MQETDFEMIDSIIYNTTLSIETKCEGNLYFGSNKLIA